MSARAHSVFLNRLYRPDHGESSNNTVLPFRGLAEGIIADETGFLNEPGFVSLLGVYQIREQVHFLLVRETRMKKASIIAATVMLIGSSAVSYAAGGSHGASGVAPGIQMQTATPSPQDRGVARGASQLTPAFEMNQYNSTHTTTPAPNGASTFAPGQRK